MNTQVARAPFSWRADPDVADFPDDCPVAVMDGKCALCTFGARVIARLDRSGDVRILPAQTRLGRALLDHHGLHSDNPESWLLLMDGRALEGFDAMIALGQRMGGWGRLLWPLRLLPKPLRRWLYARLARNRYALFGRVEMCAVPDPGLRARLLDAS